MWCLILCSFLNWFFWSFYWVLRVIYLFLDTSPFSDIWQTCYPILQIFHFLNGVLWSTIIFILMKFTLFLLLFFMLLLLYLRILCQIQGRAWRFTLMFSFINLIAFSSVQSLNHLRLFATPWTTARQASLSFTNSQRLLKLISNWVGDAIQSSHPVIPFSSCLQSFLASGSFQISSSYQVAEVLEFQLQHQSF